MAVSSEAQRIIGLSLNKIVASRSRRGGISLHRNLLVASVLLKARDVYVSEATARKLKDAVMKSEEEERFHQDELQEEFHDSEAKEQHSQATDEKVDAEKTVEQSVTPEDDTILDDRFEDEYIEFPAPDCRKSGDNESDDTSMLEDCGEIGQSLEDSLPLDLTLNTARSGSNDTEVEQCKENIAPSSDVDSTEYKVTCISGVNARRKRAYCETERAVLGIGGQPDSSVNSNINSDFCDISGDYTEHCKRSRNDLSSHSSNEHCVVNLSVSGFCRSSNSMINRRYTSSGSNLFTGLPNESALDNLVVCQPLPTLLVA
jgi:hypothetical protein